MYHHSQSNIPRSVRNTCVVQYGQEQLKVHRYKPIYLLPSSQTSSEYVQCDLLSIFPHSQTQHLEVEGLELLALSEDCRRPEWVFHSHISLQNTESNPSRSSSLAKLDSIIPEMSSLWRTGSPKDLHVSSFSLSVKNVWHTRSLLSTRAQCFLVIRSLNPSPYCLKLFSLHYEGSWLIL